MFLHYLPGKRYLLRELLPRAILLTVLFKFLPPVVPFHLFEFHGGIGTWRLVRRGRLGHPQHRVCHDSRLWRRRLNISISLRKEISDA
jgi:hypothetical protein